MLTTQSPVRAAPARRPELHRGTILAFVALAVIGTTGWGVSRLAVGGGTPKTAVIAGPAASDTPQDTGGAALFGFRCTGLRVEVFRFASYAQEPSCDLARRAIAALRDGRFSAVGAEPRDTASLVAIIVSELFFRDSTGTVRDSTVRAALQFHGRTDALVFDLSLTTGRKNVWKTTRIPKSVLDSARRGL